MKPESAEPSSKHHHLQPLLQKFSTFFASPSSTSLQLHQRHFNFKDVLLFIPTRGWHKYKMLTTPEGALKGCRHNL